MEWGEENGDYNGVRQEEYRRRSNMRQCGWTCRNQCFFFFQAEAALQIFGLSLGPGNVKKGKNKKNRSSTR